MSAQEAVSGDFGLLVLAMCVVLAVVGLVVELVSAGRALSPGARGRIGIALVGAVCALSLVAVTSVAVSDSGWEAPCPTGSRS